MTRITIAFVTLLLAGGLSAARAEDITVSILVVLASEDHKTVDDKIKAIAEEIQKKNPKLTGFRLHRTINQSLEPGKTHKMILIDKAELEIVADKRKEGENKITLTVTPPTLGRIVYSCACGKYMPMLTEYTTDKKERLVIVVMAKPCTKEAKDK